MEIHCIIRKRRFGCLALILIMVMLLHAVVNFSPAFCQEGISPVRDPMERVLAVSDLIFFQNLNPISFFREGGWALQVTPSFIMVPVLYDEEYVGTYRGIPYSVYSLGVSYNTAFTDYLLGYVSASYFHSTGAFRINDLISSFRLESTVDTFTALAGASLDIIGLVGLLYKSGKGAGNPLSNLSIAGSMGIYMQVYGVDMYAEPYPNDLRTPYVSVEDTGLKLGYYSRFSLAYRFWDCIIVTFYFMGTIPVEVVPVYFVVAADNPHGANSLYPAGKREKMDQLNLGYLDLGLVITYKSDSPFSISINLGGLIPEANPILQSEYDGMIMRTFSVTLTYSTF